MDIAVPCGSGLITWKSPTYHVRGTISSEHPGEVMPDFHRDPEETEKEEQSTVEKALAEWNFRAIDHTSS